MKVVIRPSLTAGVGAAVLLAGCAHSPSYLSASGYAADREARLGWILLIIASLVVVVVGVLVLIAMLRGRRGEASAPARTGSGLRWIYVGGIILPVLILIGVFIPTLRDLSALSAPPKPAALTVEVIGHRWWWEVRYKGQSAGELAIAANEIHVPVRQPVRFELTTGDVIHSFWFPQIGGKTDLIPGQRNITWLQADSAGTYWGQCAEYCGMEHANMRMYLVAEPPDAFNRWLERQRQPAAAAQASGAVEGERVFTGSGCALCHTIRGTTAGGLVGPDLTHVGGRHTIAAGTLPNNRGNLAGWIANPQALKPGTLMPVIGLTPGQLQAVVTYLQSLQ